MRFPKALFPLLLLSATAAAQVHIGSPEALLQYADQTAPAARQARLLPQIARQDVKLQASGLYPRVNVFATGDYYPLIPTQVIPAEVLGGDPGTFLQARFGLPYVYTAGAELSLPVVNLERWKGLERARAQYRQSEWSAKAALETFHIQLLQAYYQRLITHAVLRLNGENEAVAGELVRIMEKRHREGILNPADYNRSRSLQLDVLATGATYERTLQQSRHQLEALLHLDSLVLDDSLAAFPWPLPQAPAAWSDRAGWGEARARTDVAELALSESKKAGLPRVSLNGRYAYNQQSQYDRPRQDVAFSVANVGLRLDVPLFGGHYYRSLQQQRHLQLQSARLEQDRTEAALRQQQEDWHALYQSACKRRAVLEQKIASSRDNLRIARLQLGEGLMEFDEFNNIFMEYSRARLEGLQNLADGILYHLLSTQKF